MINLGVGDVVEFDPASVVVVACGPGTLMQDVHLQCCAAGYTYRAETFRL